jgi:two-component system, sensor histidine kinase and response regulator
MSTVLVIEDEPAVRANLVELLEAEGHSALQAADGRQGLDLAQSHRPDLVLCDVLMPGLDGYGVLDALRADPATATTPLVFLTARADRADQRRGMEGGADDYITKPYTREEVLTTLQARLARRDAVADTHRRRFDEFCEQISATIPHEILTPLSGIVGFADLLLEEAGTARPEELKEMAQAIHASAARLRGLVSDTIAHLELEIAARDEAYLRTRLVPTRLPLASLVAIAAADAARNAGREGDLRLDLEEALARVPQAYFQKAIGELVENACKFSEPGQEVVLTGRCEQGRYALSIRDHGTGLTPEEIAHIGAYTQFGRRHREQQGAGLGLVIARRVIELSGGDFALGGAPGGGTEVALRLPLAENTG